MLDEFPGAGDGNPSFLKRDYDRAVAADNAAQAALDLANANVCAFKDGDCAALITAGYDTEGDGCAGGAQSRIQ